MKWPAHTLKFQTTPPPTTKKQQLKIGPGGFSPRARRCLEPCPEPGTPQSCPKPPQTSISGPIDPKTVLSHVQKIKVRKPHSSGCYGPGCWKAGACFGCSSSGQGCSLEHMGLFFFEFLRGTVFGGSMGKREPTIFDGYCSQPSI